MTPPPFPVLPTGAGGVLAAVATWVLTYWVHGTVAAAAALAAGRWLLRAPAARDPLWKAALVVPLVSATLATAAPRPGAVPPVRLADRVRALFPGPRGRAEVRRVVLLIDGRRVERVTVRDPLGTEVSAVVVALAAVAGGLGAAGVARRRRALALAVRGRRRVDGVLPDGAAQLGAPLDGAAHSWAPYDGAPYDGAPRVGAARDDVPDVPDVPDVLDAPYALAPGCALRGLALSESAALAAPVALGPREVCVPPSFWALTPRQRRGVLVHECAHLERRDPLWIAAAELVAAASAQPLARLVVERLRRDAEFICDEVAVRRTRDARALVESLAALARPFDPAAPAATAPLVPGYLDSPLAQRAARVLGVDLARSGDPRGRRALAWSAIATLSLVLGEAPAFSTGVVMDPAAVRADDAGARRLRIVRVEAGAVYQMR